MAKVGNNKSVVIDETLDTVNAGTGNLLFVKCSFCGEVYMKGRIHKCAAKKDDSGEKK